jgi:hypothetical protein
VKINNIKNQIESAVNNIDDKKDTYDNFIEWVMSVSKYIGYRIDRDKVNMYDFLIMNKNMIKDIEVLNKLNKKTTK